MGRNGAGAFLVLVLAACAGDFGSEPDAPATARPADPPPADAGAARVCDDREDTTAQTLSRSIAYHRVRVDAGYELLAAFDAPSPYAHVARLAWAALDRVPVLDNGQRTYVTHALFSADPGRELYPPVDDAYPHHPGGLAAMMVDSALAMYTYTGDPKALEPARTMLDFMLASGRSSATDDWALVPFACSNAHELSVHGATACRPDEPVYCGFADGDGVLEPDKVAELGVRFLRWYEHTGEQRWLEAALHAARALAKHVRAGDETHSPWPFRVDASTGNVREEYTAHVIPGIALFDELARIGVAEPGFAAARATAWKWLFEYPYRNGAWSGYFEDIRFQTDPWLNPTQYIALETARWLLLHPEADPDSVAHAAHLVDWTTKEATTDGLTEGGVAYEGVQYGAETISEQTGYPHKMGSHTARFASVLALLYEKTGDASFRERAFRSFNWATYLSSDTGIVSDLARAIPRGEAGWWSDGYGDYVRHFLAGLGSVPAWSHPGEDHLLRSSSVVTRVTYGADAIRYATFDAAADDVLRLVSVPTLVRIGDRVLTTDPAAPDRWSASKVGSCGGVTVQIHRSGALAGDVEVSLGR